MRSISPQTQAIGCRVHEKVTRQSEHHSTHCQGRHYVARWVQGVQEDSKTLFSASCVHKLCYLIVVKLVEFWIFFKACYKVSNPFGLYLDPSAYVKHIESNTVWKNKFVALQHK